METRHWLEPLGSLGLLLCLLVVFQPVARATTGTMDPRPAIGYWIEADGLQSVQQLLNTPPEWQPLANRQDSLGYLGRPLWFHVQVSNDSGRPLSRFAVIKAPFLDQLDAYLVKGRHVVRHWRLGDRYPFAQRPIDHPDFILPLQIPAHGSLTLLFREDTQGTAMLPLEIWSPLAFFQNSRTTEYWQLLSYGFVLFAAFFALAVYLATRDLMYLLYSGFSLCVVVIQGSLQGILFQVFWPRWPFMNHVFLIALPLGTALLLEYSRRFFRLSPLSSRMGMLLLVSSVLAVAVPPILLLYSETLTKLFSLYFAVASALLVALISVGLWLRGRSGAALFALATFAVLAGGLLVTLRAEGLLPVNDLTISGMQLGTCSAGSATVTGDRPAHRGRAGHAFGGPAECNPGTATSGSG